MAVLSSSYTNVQLHADMKQTYLFIGISISIAE